VKKQRKPLPAKKPSHKTKAESRVLRALPILLSATLLTVLLDRFGAMRAVESYTIDLQAQVRRGDAASQVALVTIADTDASFFPSGALDPARLQLLCDRVAAARPQAIVLAIDTSDSRFRVLHPPANGVPLVASREADYSHVHDRFSPKPFLGGASVTSLSGLALHPEDGDDVVRRYRHTFRTDGGELPSLAWAAVCAARHRDPIRSADRRNNFYLQYGVARKPFLLRASDVLHMSAQPGWEQGGVLSRKIVVIGGDSASDERRTPSGWQLGSEIVAQAIESELTRSRVVPLSSPFLLILQIVQGVALLVLFQATSFRRALVISLVAIPVVSLLLSLAAYSTFARWGQFAPILIAVVAMQVYERAKETRKDLLRKITPAEETEKAAG
jgi:CHASE2 domain-containing sensor protein